VQRVCLYVSVSSFPVGSYCKYLTDCDRLSIECLKNSRIASTSRYIFNVQVADP
jgi:hypothetical protein